MFFSLQWPAAGSSFDTVNEKNRILKGYFLSTLATGFGSRQTGSSSIVSDDTLRKLEHRVPALYCRAGSASVSLTDRCLVKYESEQTNKTTIEQCDGNRIRPQSRSGWNKVEFPTSLDEV